MYDGIAEFKNDDHTCTFIINKNNDTIIVDTTSILGRQEYFHGHLLNVHQSSN
jgi:hypothetical protein